MRLSEGAVVLDIDLQGGRIAELEVDGQQLLVGFDERPTRWGSFPMIPWCGRLDRGELSFGGAVHRFPLSSPPHAIHGIAHTRRWQQVDDCTIRVGLDGPWPYGGSCDTAFRRRE